MGGARAEGDAVNAHGQMANFLRRDAEIVTALWTMLGMLRQRPILDIALARSIAQQFISIRLALIGNVARWSSSRN